MFRETDAEELPRPRGGAAVPIEHRNVRGEGGAFQPRWPNSKAMRVGYLTGLGRTAKDIALALDDGTTENTIRGQWRRHGIVDRSKLTTVPIELSGYDLGRLAGLARDRGIDPEEWIRRVLSAAIRDDLFAAIVDG